MAFFFAYLMAMILTTYWDDPPSTPLNATVYPNLFAGVIMSWLRDQVIDKPIRPYVFGTGGFGGVGPLDSHEFWRWF